MKKLSLLLLLSVAYSSYGQSLSDARKWVDTLTSPTFWGRGYTKNGMAKAAEYLVAEFKNLGLSPLNAGSYLQPFAYPVNTFPGDMDLVINGKKLVAGRDYILSPDSRGVKMQGTLQQQDSTHFINQESRIMVVLEDKLTWSVASKAEDYTVVQLNKNTGLHPETISASFQNKMVSHFRASNVCAKIAGTKKPDSVIVISAHYDHLGGLGREVYFPGANDNASGTSLLLGMAKYYAQNPPPYSMVFICFAGEEAGLKGSEYFTQHPLIPLQNIRFLVNLDLEGTGDEGITVVNATEFPAEFKMLTDINEGGRYLKQINARAKAANSDHYWFTEKGVPAFFLYTLGGIKAYHDVFDRPETLPLNEYEDLAVLLKMFVGTLTGN